MSFHNWATSLLHITKENFFNIMISFLFFTFICIYFMQNLLSDPKFLFLQFLRGYVLLLSFSVQLPLLVQE